MSALERTQRLRQRLDAEGLDALLISQPENRFYLSGFNGSAGFLVISRDHAFIATDFRYYEQSARQCPDYTLLKMAGPKPFGWFHEALAEIKPRRFGFEASDVSFSFYSAIKSSIAQLPSEERPRLMSTPRIGRRPSGRSRSPTKSPRSTGPHPSLTRPSPRWSRPSSPA